jgi:hypothetical protein
MTAAWVSAAWVRRGATALAAARTAIGVVALASPALVGRPWVGEVADGAGGRVLARALGGRDLALGLGTLAVLRQLPPTGAGGTDGTGGTDGADRAVGLWVGMGAIADSFDVLATAASWDELPTVTRWLVAATAGGAAVAGGAAAWSLLTGGDGRAA